MPKRRLYATPSKLIRQALEDLRAVEKNKEYIVDMGEWHSPRPRARNGPRCCVCLTGAVMAQSMGVPIDDSYDPLYVEDSTVRNKLFALNSFRSGAIDAGLNWLGKQLNGRLDSIRWITPYDSNPGQFKRDMLKLAKDLEKVRL